MQGNITGEFRNLLEYLKVGESCHCHGEIMYEDTSWIEDDCPDTFSEFIFLFPLALQLLCVMISHWLTVLKHKMPSQILIKNAGLVW